MVRRWMIVCAMVTLAGCAPMEWRKAGVTAEVAAADAAECRRIAQVQAWRLEWRRGLFSHGHLVRGADGRLYRAFDPFFDDGPFEDRFFLEQELEDDCLRAKGYELVPLATAP
jgi:hypothetical protein